MEDRKRAALSAEDIAPPSKRQQLNGGNPSREDAGDSKDEAWIEAFTKDAIYRQMQEYKREKATIESRLQEVEKRSTHHNDHLRIVDAWWVQLLQEVQLLAEGNIEFEHGSEDRPFPPFEQFREIPTLQAHLDDKASSIKSTLEALFVRINGSRGKVPSDVTTLETKVDALLASQKDLLVKLDRLNAEKDDLSEQLNTATLRYMKAERKLDRAKSSQVQKLEQQALARATSQSTGNSDAENGIKIEETNGISGVAQAAYQEAMATVEKQKAQLDTAMEQNKTMQEELTTLQLRLTNLTDEDYARTDIFKSFKTHQEDLLKRINHLESTNKALQERASNLEQERTLFHDKLENESLEEIRKVEAQWEADQKDLARIRSARDEFSAEVAKLRASAEQERQSLNNMKELVSAKDDRIATLESELERLQSSEHTDSRPDVDELPVDELRQKFKKLQQDFDSINKELPSMTTSLRKFQGLAHKRVMDFAALEDRVAVLIAEKTKADHKYFGAHKNNDTLKEELSKLRMANGKSSEIISQLKEVGNQNRTLLSNKEKQLETARMTNMTVLNENKKLETSTADAIRKYDSLRTQIAELNNLVKSKDTSTTMARERLVSVEQDLEKAKVKLEYVQKDCDNWKKKSLGNTSDEEELLRKLATCTVCEREFKNSALKTCGHVFCKGCLELRIQNRMRKCPNCNRGFDKSDILSVHL